MELKIISRLQEKSIKLILIVQILIFTDFKKIGAGHYERSLRLKKKLEKKKKIFFIKILTKKNKKISLLKKPSIIYYDFRSSNL